LKTEHAAFSQIEHDTVEKLRLVSSQAKDLGKKDSLAIPSVSYIAADPNRREVEFSRGGTYLRIFPGSTDGVRYNPDTNQSHFVMMASLKQEDLAGPLTARDVRLAINKRITEIQRQSKVRDITIGSYTAALNMPVHKRINLIVVGKIEGYVFFVMPAAFVTCLITSRFRNRIRFKPNRLRLA
jgi:hypothetical protein